MDTITKTSEPLFFFFFLSALKENFTRFAAYFFSVRYAVIFFIFAFVR